jgi:hypothetical protein
MDNKKQKQVKGNEQKSTLKSQSGTKADSAAKHFVDGAILRQDPFGSYTGHPKETGEQPTQDADDL